MPLSPYWSPSFSLPGFNSLLSLEVEYRGFLSPYNFETLLSLSLSLSLPPAKFPITARCLRLITLAFLLFPHMPSFVTDMIRLALQRHFSPYLLPIRLSNLSFVARPIRGVAFVITITSFHFLSVWTSPITCAFLFSGSFVETCMQAWRWTGGRRCMHGIDCSLSYFRFFCSVTLPPHPLPVPCIISFLFLRILELIISEVWGKLYFSNKEYHHHWLPSGSKNKRTTLGLSLQQINVSPSRLRQDTTKE